VWGGGFGGGPSPTSNCRSSITVIRNTARFVRPLQLGAYRIVEDRQTAVLLPTHQQTAADGITQPPVPTANAFQFTTQNLEAVTLDSTRMLLNPKSAISAHLQGDGTLTLTILGRFPAAIRVTLDGLSVPITITPNGLTATLPLDGRVQQLMIARRMPLAGMDPIEVGHGRSSLSSGISKLVRPRVRVCVMILVHRHATSCSGPSAPGRRPSTP
jgi:hypothetical protein